DRISFNDTKDHNLKQEKNGSFRDSEINKSPLLLVFRLVFCVASRVKYPDFADLANENRPKTA
ncbi:MAG: hypothetical protein LWX52_16720, partial [Deltaproteobacteria bacterium]|nr:hypothetical protein [Deltaproteobacteria bacterium]